MNNIESDDGCSGSVPAPEITGEEAGTTATGGPPLQDMILVGNEVATPY